MGDYFTDVVLKELPGRFNKSLLKGRCEELMSRKDIQPIIEKHGLKPVDFFFLHDHIQRMGNYEERATEVFENKELIEWYFDHIGKLNNSVTPDQAIEFGIKIKRTK